MDLERELDEALMLLGDFDVFDSVPDDHGYLGSGLQKRTAAFLVKHGRYSVSHHSSALSNHSEGTASGSESDQTNENS